MDIVIGRLSDVVFDNRPNFSPKDGTELIVRLLATRRARSRVQKFWRGKDRRGMINKPDPINAKVLILLVPEGNRLPHDIEEGNYQFRLKIVPQNNKTQASSPDDSLEKGFTCRI